MKLLLIKAYEQPSIFEKTHPGYALEKKYPLLAKEAIKPKFDDWKFFTGYHGAGIEEDFKQNKDLYNEVQKVKGQNNPRHFMDEWHNVNKFYHDIRTKPTTERPLPKNYNPSEYLKKESKLKTFFKSLLPMGKSVQPETKYRKTLQSLTEKYAPQLNVSESSYYKPHTVYGRIKEPKDKLDFIDALHGYVDFKNKNKGDTGFLKPSENEEKYHKKLWDDYNTAYGFKGADKAVKNPLDAVFKSIKYIGVSKSISEKDSDSMVSSVAVMHDGFILMGKRKDNGKWVLPGGHGKQGENPVECALRELHEESGIKADKNELTYLGHERITNKEGEQLMIHAFLLNDRFNRTSSAKDPDEEVSKWDWIDVKKGLPEDILNNLHSNPNVTLRMLDLQPDEKEKEHLHIITTLDIDKSFDESQTGLFGVKPEKIEILHPDNFNQNIDELHKKIDPSIDKRFAIGTKNINGIGFKEIKEMADPKAIYKNYYKKHDNRTSTEEEQKLLHHLGKYSKGEISHTRMENLLNSHLQQAGENSKFEKSLNTNRMKTLIIKKKEVVKKSFILFPKRKFTDLKPAENPCENLFDELFKSIEIKHPGLLTKKAKEHKMEVQAFADHVLSHKEGFDESTISEAQFAVNARKFKYKSIAEIFEELQKESEII